MRSRRRTTAIALTGAVALASAAYGLGSQADDGSAVARGEADRAGDVGPRGHMRLAPLPAFTDLADTLGVDADELRGALRDFHESKAGERRDVFAEALAEALGKPVEDVTEALDGLREKHQARFAARLARALDLDADRVREALENVKGDAPRPPHELVDALADELGVDAADVRRALFEQRFERARPPRHPGLPLRGLASALDVSRAELRKAFRELRTGAENRFEDHQRELAEFLADRFDLGVDEVEGALEALPRPAPHPRGGRPGPGGPGAFALPL
jgi:hypothetical protein